jgi:hypothetical protein
MFPHRNIYKYLYIGWVHPERRIVVLIHL